MRLPLSARHACSPWGRTAAAGHRHGADDQILAEHTYSQSPGRWDCEPTALMPRRVASSDVPPALIGLRGAGLQRD